jgi:hypothetical protein
VKELCKQFGLKQGKRENYQNYNKWASNEFEIKFMDIDHAR